MVNGQWSGKRAYSLDTCDGQCRLLREMAEDLEATVQKWASTLTSGTGLDDSGMAGRRNVATSSKSRMVKWV